MLDLQFKKPTKRVDKRFANSHITGIINQTTGDRIMYGLTDILNFYSRSPIMIVSEAVVQEMKKEHDAARAKYLKAIRDKIDAELSGIETTKEKEAA